MIAKCGRECSNRGKEFTTVTLKQHESSCKDCKSGTETAESLGLGMTDLIAHGESDGVYWGIARELGEWY